MEEYDRPRSIETETGDDVKPWDNGINIAKQRAIVVTHGHDDILPPNHRFDVILATP